MNRKLFFNEVRSNVIGKPLTQGVVDTLSVILDTCEQYKVVNLNQVAYVLATAHHESYLSTLNPDWLPVREGWCKSNACSVSAVTKMFNEKKISRNYALPQPNGLSYYGRGFVQITHPENYKALGRRIDVDIYDNPDKALERITAAKILVVGMKEGLFTGVSLSTYIYGNTFRFIDARKIINGVDANIKIAALASKYQKSLNL